MLLNKKMYSFLYSLLFYSILSCNTGPNDHLNSKILATPTPLSAETIALTEKLYDIERKAFENSGAKIVMLRIDGVEPLQISMKEFYVEEKMHQQKDFKNYLNYLDRFANTKSPLNNKNERLASQSRHNAAIQYLDELIKTASSEKTVLKVAYYLQVGIDQGEQNLAKTTYLDDQYKPMRVSYQHLIPKM